METIKNKMASATDQDIRAGSGMYLCKVCVRVSEGCEGNRCLFTGRGGELMALSPLCSGV